MSAERKTPSLQLSLGVEFKSNSGKSMVRNLVQVPMSGSVKHGLQDICRKAATTAGAAADATGTAAVTIGKEAKMAAKNHTRKALKTFGSVFQLKPHEIPKDYQDLILEALAKGADNAPKEGNPGGYTEIGDFGLLNKAATWIDFDGDVGMVIFLDENNQAAGAYGKISMPLN